MIIGIDPSTTDYLGIGIFDPLSGEMRLESLACLPEMERTLRERFLPTMDRHLGNTRPITMVIEKPPPTARKDTQHSKQARIGDAMGWSGGLVAGAMMARYDAAFLRYSPDQWRETLVKQAHTLGIPNPHIGSTGWLRQQSVSGPSNQRGFELVAVENKRGVYTRRWRGCGHHDPKEIPYAQLGAEEPCSVCAPAPVLDRATLVRRGWKRLACEVAAARWPDAYQALYALRTTRSKATDPAMIPGLPDSCEAAFLALHHHLVSV